jgi:outer membrane protein OmpA-like peptidoglycan-associated protein
VKLLSLFILLATHAHGFEFYLKKKFTMDLGFGLAFPVGTSSVNKKSDEGPSPSFDLAYFFSDHWGLGLGYEGTDFEKSNLKQSNYQLYWSYRLSKLTSDWLNQIEIGAGISDVDKHPLRASTDNSYTKEHVGLNMKMRYLATDNIALGGFVGYRYTMEKDYSKEQIHAVRAGVMFTMFFGGQEKVMDTDRDGIVDHRDQCKETPFDMPVDDRGCSQSQNDVDRDGVSDDEDDCPDTPQDEVSNELGCSKSQKDQDQDGVIDLKDQCPHSPKDIEVNEAGCGDSEKVEMALYLQFKLGSAEIEGDAESEVRKVVDFLEKYPDFNIEIEGHTDDTGARDYNLKLSEKRAAAVKNLLINEYKVKAERIKSVGLGPDFPIADNKTREGREKNRRVMAKFYTYQMKEKKQDKAAEENQAEEAESKSETEDQGTETEKASSTDQQSE